jgi:hypothetical protein
VGGIGMCLWCCWKDLDEQDLIECGDIDFQVISAIENSNKFQKTRYWKGKIC